jgi:hypothetical protein
MNLPGVDYSGNATCAVIFYQSNWSDIFSYSTTVFYLHEINILYLKSFTVKTIIYYNGPLITCITSVPLTKRYDTD